MNNQEINNKILTAHIQQMRVIENAISKQSKQHRKSNEPKKREDKESDKS